MILLNVNQVVKHYGPEPTLDGASFEVRPGERLALVGPNGAGKTTLLRIISGQLEPEAGRVEVHSSARIEYLEQQPDFAPGKTVWEEAYSGLASQTGLAQELELVAMALSQENDAAEHRRLARRYDHLQHELERQDAYNLDHKVEQVLDGLGFARSSHQQPVEQLSGGQQNRLMLARILLAQPDLMLLDEPSNHLDIEATEWLEDFLLAGEQALLVVSHDRYFLDKVTTRTLELVDGTVDSYPGNFSAYWRQKAERLEVQRRTYDKQQEQIAKTEDFIRRNHYGQKSAQAEDRRKKLERIERVERPREIASPPMSFPAAERSGDIVLRAEHLSKGYDRPLFEDLSFQITRGQRWGVLGPNGSGKTTLLRCLVSHEKLDAGDAILGTGVKPAYYDQQLTGLADDDQVADAIRPKHKEFNLPQRRDLLARFGIRGDMVFQKVGSLSGGERSRAALAQLAARDANFLILDEPTNHLDLWARDSLERAILAFDGTVLFVSHDRYFLNRVADHVMVVEPGRFRVIEGNYDAYLHLVKQGLATGEAIVGAAKGASSAGSKRAGRGGGKAEAGKSGEKNKGTDGAKPKRRFPYRKLADLEAEIFDRESRIEELQQAYADPEVLRDGQRIKAIQVQVAEEQRSLETLYEHWEEAAELN